MTKDPPSTTDLILVEQIVQNDSPRVGVAYLLAIFLGLLSGHRFYLKRPVTAIMQILSYVFLIGFAWLLIDLFLIPGMVRDDRARIRRREMTKLAALRPVVAGSEPAPPSVSVDLVNRLLMEREA